MKYVLALLIAAPLFAQTADLKITHVYYDPTQLLVGNQPVDRIFIINNLGPQTATNVRVHFDVEGGTITRTFGFTGACTNDCRMGDISGAADHVIAIYINIPLPVHAHVTATVTSDSVDPDPTNNSATDDFEVLDAPELYVSAENKSPQYRPGQRGVLDVLFGNVGSMAAHDVVLTVDLPPGSRFTTRTGDDGWSCDVDGTRTICRIDTLPVNHNASSHIFFGFVNVPQGNGGYVNAFVHLASIEREIQTWNNRSSASWQVPKFFAATTTDDSGPGSLRDTILAANASCDRETLCDVGFRIPPPLPPSGFITIQPRSPLPTATFIGFIDGAAENDVLDVDSAKPLVFLDGSLQPSGDGVTTSLTDIEQLAIGNFPRFGVTGDEVEIRNSYVGVDPTGRVAAPNLYGMVVNGAYIENCVVSANRHSGILATAGISVNSSRIGLAADSDDPLPNGASGIYVPGPDGTTVRNSVIAWNHGPALALNSKQHNVIVDRTSIFGNGGGIDYGLDGRTFNDPIDSVRPPNFPIIDDARYDAASGKTIISLHVVSYPSPPQRTDANQSSVRIYADVFANDDGGEQAQHYLGFTVTSLEVPGDLRGKTITAITHRERYDCYYDICTELYETSEISLPVPVR